MGNVNFVFVRNHLLLEKQAEIKYLRMLESLRVRLNHWEAKALEQSLFKFDR